MSSLPAPSPQPDAAHFAAPVCRNCDAPLTAPYCGQCGQKKVGRLGKGAVGAEIWQSWRLFELSVLKAAWQILRWPGRVAREYVLGARTRHMHPLKLLLLAIGAMLLVLSRSNQLDSSGDARVSVVMEQVRAYSNWSFSLTIVAFAVASLLLFRRRGGFNLVEHLVLAVYCHFLVICVSVVIKLPTLFFRDPEFLAGHKSASRWFMDAIGVLVLTLAFKQFFALDLRRDGWRLALAAVVFLVTKWGLQRLYGLALFKLILS